MKRTKVLISLFTTALLLSGCSERDSLMEEGKKAYVAGDFLKSNELLTKANRLETLVGEDYKVYYEVQSALFKDYYLKGDEATSNFEYEKALSNYEGAYEIYEGDEELPDKIANVKKLLEKQQKFNEYTTFYQGILKESNQILDELNKEVDALYVDAVSKKNFVLKVKGLLSNSNAVITKLDNSFSILEDEGIIEIHQELIDVVQQQHQTLQYALNYEDEYGDGLGTLSQQLMEIKRNKTYIHQSLKNYAKENLLLFSFNNTKEVDEQETTETNNEKEEEVTSESSEELTFEGDI